MARANRLKAPCTLSLALSVFTLSLALINAFCVLAAFIVAGSLWHGFAVDSGCPLAQDCRYQSISDRDLQSRYTRLTLAALIAKWVPITG